MTSQIIRLDPAFPLCWESLDTLRIGFEQAEVLLHRPSAGAQRFISLLRTGVDTADMNAATHRSGITGMERRRLLQILEPVLACTPAPPPAALEFLRETGTPPGSGQNAVPGSASVHPAPVGELPLRVDVIGHGRFSARLARTLTNAGIAATLLDSRDTSSTASSTDLALLVEHFIEPATRAQHLLTEGVPHLPIRLTDRSVSVGPLIQPDSVLCLGCVELQDLARDPVAAVLAAQLVSIVPSAATEECAERTGALILVLLDHWRRGVPELFDSRLKYPVRDGLVAPVPEVTRLTPQRECGCVALAAA